MATEQELFEECAQRAGFNIDKLEGDTVFFEKGDYDNRPAQKAWDLWQHARALSHRPRLEKRTPTEPGYYWFWDTGSDIAPVIVYIRDLDGQLLMANGGAIPNGQYWAGPLAEPYAPWEEPYKQGY